MSLYMGQTKIPDVRIGGGGAPQTAVLYTPMEPELKPEEKEQARKNIGATDISLGLTGMAVGDKVEVAGVDTRGVPTAWKRAEKYELIDTIIIPDGEEVDIIVDKEPDGTPYNFKSMRLLLQKAAGKPTNIYIDVKPVYQSVRHVAYITWASSSTMGVVEARNVGGRLVPFSAQTGGYELASFTAGELQNYREPGPIVQIHSYGKVAPRTRIEVWAVRI